MFTRIKEFFGKIGAAQRQLADETSALATEAAQLVDDVQRARAQVAAARAIVRETFALDTAPELIGSWLDVETIDTPRPARGRKAKQLN